jgi:transposase, IS5 family
MQGKNESNPIKASRKRASTAKYVSPNQLTFCGFETPFEQKLTKENRWVKLSSLIPWDKIVTEYDNLYSAVEGRPPINGRLVLGTIIIKHYLDLTDRETISQIEENMFMQYFIGYSSFSNEAPFSHTMLSKIRAKLNIESISKINAIIVGVKSVIDNEDQQHPQPPDDYIQKDLPTANKGRLLMDATVAPQNITFPTDLKMLNASRVKLEEIIDKLYIKQKDIIKPRTYREEALKEFLNIAKKKRKTYNQIYEAKGKQLNYVKRNFRTPDLSQTKMLLIHRLI